ncbi:hypothetical protein ACOME3_007192 [Neoechinorhynchus agilis]
MVFVFKMDSEKDEETSLDDFPNKSFNWLFSPADIDDYTDTNIRTFGVYIIRKLADTLKAESICISTALVMMHRVFTVGPISVSTPRAMYPAACLFVACKTEDHPIKSTKMAIAYLQVRPTDELTEVQVAELLIRAERRVMGILVCNIKIDHPQPNIIVSFNECDEEFCNEAIRSANDIYVLTKLCVLQRCQFLTAVAIRATEIRLKRSPKDVGDGWKEILNLKEGEMEMVEREANLLLDEDEYIAARLNARHYDRAIY